MDGISRRSLLGGLVGAAALAAAGCSSDSDDSGGGPEPSRGGPSSGAGGPSGSGPTGPDGASAPAHVRMEGIEPDLPGEGNVPSAFFTYPDNPVSYADVPVGDGEQITVFGPQYGTGTPEDKSPWWQNLNKVLGVEIKLQTVPGADLNTKQQALLAGGNFPDIAIINPGSVPLGALQKYFTDLGPYLAGDAVKEYPGLATIPSLAWKTPTINGTLFGVPQPRLSAGMAFGVRKDLLDKKGVAADYSNGDEFIAFLKEINDPGGHQWALGESPNWLLWAVMEMHGVPNYTGSWIEEDGKFTYMYEAEPMKDCLSIAQKAWKDGYFHPDSAQYNQAWFAGGICLTWVNHFPAFSGQLIANPDIEIELVPFPKWQGGGAAVKQLGAGAGGNYAAFNSKADPDRIKQLLRFADYIAAPMGTTEFLNVNYGEAGVSYTMTDGNPVLTDSGKADQPSAGALGYVSAQALNVLYTPGHRDFVQHEYDYLKTAMAQTQSNPALGLYSPTALSSTGQTADLHLSSMNQGVFGDILYGRKPVSAYDDAIKKWRGEGGDKIRQELEEAYATTH